MRIPLIAAAGAALALTAPAAAAAGPVCATHLANAATGATRTCATSGKGTDASGGWSRTVTLEVAAGTAQATLRCYTYYRSWTGSVTVTGPGVDYLATSDDATCEVTLTALADGTTATATSTTAYFIHWE